MLFKLSEVITAILAMRIVIQFMAQAVGMVLLRKRFGATGSTIQNVAVSIARIHFTDHLVISCFITMNLRSMED